jgi:hypothetical protein
MRNDVPQTLELPPGSYTFGTLFGSSFTFEVTAAGTVDYAVGPPLDDFLEGRGTTTLRVNGFKIDIDATPLSFDQFWLMDSASGLTLGRPTTAVQTVRLIPGIYRFGTLVSPQFLFEVTGDGTVDFVAGPPLDDFLEGRGTTTLRVNGFKIDIDATPLSMSAFWLQDSLSGLTLQRPTTAVEGFRLIPGTYRFATMVSPHFLFDVGPGGSVEYPIGPMDRYVSGRGSALLRVNGYLVGIDATRLGPASFTVRDAASGLTVAFTTHSFHCMSLLPGEYQFACGFVFLFRLEDPGVFAYSPGLEPCVTGAGGQRLSVSCDPGP